MLQQNIESSLVVQPARVDMTRGPVLYRQILDQLGTEVLFDQAWIVTTMPRGGLQIIYPGTVPDSLVKAYSRESHRDDELSWRAMMSGAPLIRAEVHTAATGASARYQAQMMLPNNWHHAAAAPLTSPVWQGYPGALHAYRTQGQPEFTREDLEKLEEAAVRLNETVDRTRGERRSAEVFGPRWTHQLSERFIILSEAGEVIFGERGFNELDEALREQIRNDAQERLTHPGEQTATGSRLALADANGDRWIFRAAAYPSYPALGEGGFAFYCAMPDCADWRAVRPGNFQADDELSRLIPAAHFMQDEFHRGPTLNEIAKTVHLSPFHFHRRFSELLGITPKHFLLECQIFECKSRLAANDKDLVDIAASCGFAHQSHFTSRFKQATGLTPTRWRKLAHRTNGEN